MKAKRLAAWHIEKAEFERQIDLLRTALGWFVADTRFHVGVAGNPIVVDQMISEAIKIYQETEQCTSTTIN